MTAKLDRGPVVAQTQLEMDSSLTLRQSYQQLVDSGCELFPTSLDAVLRGEPGLEQFDELGTYHSKSQLAQYSFLLAEDGWDTPSVRIKDYGRDKGLWKT